MLSTLGRGGRSNRSGEQSYLLENLSNQGGGHRDASSVSIATVHWYLAEKENERVRKRERKREREKEDLAMRSALVRFFPALSESRRSIPRQSAPIARSVARIARSDRRNENGSDTWRRHVDDEARFEEAHARGVGGIGYNRRLDSHQGGTSCDRSTNRDERETTRR